MCPSSVLEAGSLSPQSACSQELFLFLTGVHLGVNTRLVRLVGISRQSLYYCPTIAVTHSQLGKDPSGSCHKQLYGNGPNCFAKGLGDWMRGTINIISDITLYLTVSQKMHDSQIFFFLICNY